MKLLLDTHTFLWFVEGSSQISRKARRRIEDARNDRFLSAASIWEMAIKINLGKLRLGMPLSEYIDRGAIDNAIAVLDIGKEHAVAVSSLPKHHSDPFDRLIVAQAIYEGMNLIARDTAFDVYAVKRIW